MVEWILRDLLAEAEVQVEGPVPPAWSRVHVRSLTVDSRKVEPGACFVAVSGTASDGHRFVGDAIRAGATAVVVEREVEVPAGVVRVRVADTHAATARLAAAYYGIRRAQRENRLCLVGITGTNGKSTTTCLLRSILEAAGHRTALLGTIRYDLLDATVTSSLTTPAPVELCSYLAKALSAGATHAVMEVSSHALAQRRCDGLEFEVGVFTNLTGDHLDYHRTTGEYLAAKKRLFDGLAADAHAAVNAEDPVAADIVADCRARIHRYGIDGRALDARGIPRHSDWLGSTFDITLGSRTLSGARTLLLGRHNIMNSLAAVAAAFAMDVPDEAIREGLERVRVVDGRLQRVSPDDCPFAVIVDYAHTDDALANALRGLRPLTKGRLLCVFGCGGDRDRSKRPRMARTVARLADAAYVTSDNPRSEDPRAIIDEILPGFEPASGCAVQVDPDRAATIRAAIAAARPGDTVLIAGKGHETYQIIGDLRMHFDDAEVAGECLGVVETSR